MGLGVNPLGKSEDTKAKGGNTSQKCVCVVIILPVHLSCERKNRLGGKKNEIVLRDHDPYLTFTVSRHGGG